MSKIKTRFKKLLILVLKELQDPYYQGVAAQISFYLMLSIVPTIVLITQVLGLFGISLESAVNLISDYTGKTMSGMVVGLFEFSSAGVVNIFFVVVALWGASRTSFAMMRVTNYTLSNGKNTGKGFISERIRAIKTMAITIFTIVISLVILAYGKIILISVVSILGLEDSGIVEGTWMWLRWILGFGLYFFMVSYNYYILPTEKMRFKKILPGSIFASAGMLIVTYGYSIYTSSLANYDVLYGALSSVVAIMFWFFFLAWVMCFGLLFNKVWDDSADEPI